MVELVIWRMWILSLRYPILVLCGNSYKVILSFSMHRFYVEIYRELEGSGC